MSATDQRRALTLDAVTTAIENCAKDLQTFPDKPGVALLVADRLVRLTNELRREL